MFSGFRLRLAAARLLTVVVGLGTGDGAVALVADCGLAVDADPSAQISLPDSVLRRADAMASVAAAELSADTDPELSHQYYLRALDLDPANAAAAQELATVYLSREEIPEALAVLKDSHKRNPQSVSLALRIAGIYVIKLRKFEAAENYSQQALRAAPDDIEPYQMLYTIYRATGRATAADGLLRQAAARQNKDPAFWAGLADLHDLRDHQHQKEDSSGRSAAEVPAAVQQYRRASTLARQDAPVLHRAMDFFFDSGLHEDALAAARRLLLLDPSDTQIREKLALILDALGRDDEAVVELDKVVAEDPESVFAYRVHGEILLKREDYAGAVSKFEKALALHDDDPRLYLELADLCLKSHDPERAARWLAKARGNFSRLPELPFYEGQVLGYLNRWKEALLAFNVSADLAAKYQPSFINADFHFQRGVAAERAGARDEALLHFRSCLALDSDYAPALNYLGYMWADQGQNLAEAEDFVRRALAREPDNTAYLDSLGWVLYRQGRYHEALVPLESAAKLSPSPDPTIHEHLGDTLSKLGRDQDAMRAWARAAALDGASPALAAKLQGAHLHVGKPADEAKATDP
jgi:tetratricopeptide (TPR) repeat protein